MIKEAIILAGGFGTRLQSVVANIPKPMALVNSKPFLSYILDFCAAQGIKKVILAVGYKHKVIQDYCKTRYKDIEIDYSIEESPLGTGGGIKKALQKCNSKNVLILNGDSFLRFSLDEMNSAHKSAKSKFTMALKPMKNYDRYGTVEIDKENKLIAFKEKEATKQGLINAGVYLINRAAFNQLAFADIFSFETEFLIAYIQKWKFNGFISDGMFIDIGIPEDYEKAQKLF